jgi:iron complex outermembrane receptor protein
MLSDLRAGRRRGQVAQFCLSASSLTLITAAMLGGGTPSFAQTAPQGQETAPLPQVTVETQQRRRTRARPAQPGRGRTLTRTTAPAAAPASPATTTAPAGGTAGGAQSPLNTNSIATSATRLGIPVLEVAASVEVVSQQTMREQAIAPMSKS